MMIQKYQLQIDESNLNEIIGDLPYGKLKKIEI
jgi:hypothetical protein